MTQNRSSAVMQQRREPHDSLDDFPTPPWATRALIEHLVDVLWWPHVDNDVVREPAANRGYMVRALHERFRAVEASDVHDYGAGFPVLDYLWGPRPTTVDWTITNPPFRLAQQFIDRALETSRKGVAMFVRSSFLEGADRYHALFKTRRPKLVLQFVERVVIHKGKLVKKGSSATAYSWVVWQCGPWPSNRNTEFDWIAPCRRRLERPADYDLPSDRK